MSSQINYAIDRFETQSFACDTYIINTQLVVQFECVLCLLHWTWKYRRSVNRIICHPIKRLAEFIFLAFAHIFFVLSTCEHNIHSSESPVVRKSRKLSAWIISIWRWCFTLLMEREEETFRRLNAYLTHAKTNVVKIIDFNAHSQVVRERSQLRRKKKTI